MGLETLSSDPRMENLIFLHRMDSEQKVLFTQLNQQTWNTLGSTEDMWMGERRAERIISIVSYRECEADTDLKDLPRQWDLLFITRSNFSLLIFTYASDFREIYFMSRLKVFLHHLRSFLLLMPDRRQNETRDRHVRFNNRKWY